MEYLFVYGTLRKALDIPMLQKLKGKVEWVGDAKVQGRLYDIGDYPGALQIEGSENEHIVGDVFKVNDPLAVFGMLDEYERFDEDAPAGSEYVRKSEPVELNGKEISVCIYWYNFPVEGKHLISDGDYLGYLNKKKTA